MKLKSLLKEFNDITIQLNGLPVNLYISAFNDSNTISILGAQIEDALQLSSAKKKNENKLYKYIIKILESKTKIKLLPDYNYKGAGLAVKIDMNWVLTKIK